MCDKQDKRCTGLFGGHDSRDVEENMDLEHFRGKMAVLGDITMGRRAGA